ncbi:MAG: UDP-N-acetylmuramoyl-L-alanyl-D-glutamate--2,6-diaminopimelate ligase [Rhodospirillales bacterium]|nr:UDP-N-acetylmuramoyl-L-alanyl-D-glutamate--2,6-diaminopimelate ligase [Rhodospirillales bacterium]
MIANGAHDLGMDIAGLTCDSRAVGSGYLFAALPGTQSDGRDFITSAVEKGAVCVLGPVGTVAAVPVLESDNPRSVFARMAANFYPRQPETIAAITGTNGKTSTAFFLRQIWTQLGRKAASLGTIGVHGAGFNEPGKLTTPDPVKLHETLQRLADAGVSNLAMEASSHGLEQFRLDGVRVRAAGFTNITRDHLDYHGTMQAYLAAKLRLFSDVVEIGGAAVINADVPEAQEVVATARKRGLEIITYGRAGNTICVVEREAKAGGQRLSLRIGSQNFTIHLPLAGKFQAENALCALGLAIGLGADVADAVAALEKLEGVPGRMQYVGAVNGADVYVDYAHTPDALENVLSALRPHTQNKLHVLFGCGGDRDPGKRAEMGAIAAKLADVVIVTDDNPRSEQPAAIRAQILTVAPGAQEIANRHDAIRTAVAALGHGDVLVLAGKGHEQGQIVGAEVLPFDDVMEAKAAIGEVQA